MSDTVDIARTRADARMTFKSLAVATITMARYLKAKDPLFAAYLVESLNHAQASGLSAEDVSFLATLVKAVGPTI